MKNIILSISFLLIFINSFSQCLTSETDFENYFTENYDKLDPIEGIWSYNVIITRYFDGEIDYKKSSQNYIKMAIIKDGNDYRICSISDKQSDTIIKITSTALQGIYLYNKMTNLGIKVNSTNLYLTGSNLIEFTYTDTKEEIIYNNVNSAKNKGISLSTIKADAELTEFIKEYKLIKVFPLNSSTKNIASSGTGFAISSSGYIATCNHVIDGATSIIVKGIGGDFSKFYKATVISTDANNDLAIIKIDDATLTTLGTIPYTISSSTSDVGTTIYTLGYPLTATMGDEIKLTDGVVSAKSGYKGDITSYQISAAAQQGNSGGPLFDKYGNLIGVVNAKYVSAENATYAVKSTYLKNLIDALPTTITLQTANSLTWKVLTEQVKSIKNFIYIIEVN